MPHVTLLTSIADLRAAAPRWNDLWQRSDCTSPLTRAEMVAQWLEHFAPRQRFQAIVVEDRGRWLAALPLVQRRMTGIIRAGVLPCNAWPSGATLLWDKDIAPNVLVSLRETANISRSEMSTNATAADEVGRVLLAAAQQLPWPLVFLEAVMPERASWQAFGGALTAAKVPFDLKTRWHVGRLAIDHDWSAAWKSLPRKHRQRIAAALRKLTAQGAVGFELHKQLAANKVEPLLRRAWAVEERGWKGAAGTSVLGTPSAAEFMLRQAQCLAAENQLWLAFLRCGAHDAAFCYGVFAKGVLHSLKIGYDAALAACSPGHLLQYHLLQALHADPTATAIDYIGPMTEYHASWRPHSYPFAQLTFAPRGRLLAQATLWGYQLWRRLKISSTSPTGLPTRRAISAAAKP